MRNAKKFLAVATAATMVLTPASAFAAAVEDTQTPATGNVESDSYLEGVTPEDVFTVVLPTATADTYKFVLDPDQLLYQIDQAASGSAYADTNLFFTNVGSPNTYSATSDGAVAVNKGMTDVVLSVDVAVSNVKTNPVTFVQDPSDFAGENLGLYLALVPAAKGTVTDAATATVGAATAVQAKAVGTDGKASMSFYLAGQPDNYELKQEADDTVTSGHKYSFTKKAAPSNDWNTAGFYLSGECDSDADWSAFNAKSQLATGGENLKVTVVWTMDNATEEEQALKGAANGTTGVMFSTTNTFSDSSDGSKYFFKPASSVTSISSITVYSLAEYASSGNSVTSKGTLTSSDYSISGSGNILISKAALSGLSLGTGNYIVEIVTDNGTFTATYSEE